MTDDAVAARRALRDHFESEHDRRADPWHVMDRWYEVRKRAVTMAALPSERYGSTLEIGCSIGALTDALADRSDRVVAVDIADSAVTRARERLADRPHVRVDHADIAEGVPPGPWDLVVLSEVGYYLGASDLIVLLGRIESELTSAGTVVACHWRHPESDVVLQGDAVHRPLAFETDLDRVVHHEERDFVLDVYVADSSWAARRDGVT